MPQERAKNKEILILNACSTRGLIIESSLKSYYLILSFILKKLIILKNFKKF